MEIQANVLGSFAPLENVRMPFVKELCPKKSKPSILLKAKVLRDIKLIFYWVESTVKR